MDILQKLEILSAAAKYDVACTSSGVERRGRPGSIGNTAKAGICHSFSSDGRCISLLKVLLSNDCAFDCAYCVNRHSRDVPRVSFTVDELVNLTIQFYRRNYIEGLFLSSAVVKSPDYTCELMLSVIKRLREQENFRGYIHVKAIPGASSRLTEQMGLYADRMSVNIELPSKKSLSLLAPQKSREKILSPMAQIRDGITESSAEMVKYRSAPKFVPAGQSTQMIIGATPESDYRILTLTEKLYRRFSLKRVFFSAYMPIVEDRNLPAKTTPPPLLREHRLYQADWLLRFYGFSADEILDSEHPNLNLSLDPKCGWALNHMELFPVDVNRAPYEMLLRVPGIGIKSAMRIRSARRYSLLRLEDLKKLGVVIKRAKFFVVCSGRGAGPVCIDSPGLIAGALSDLKGLSSRLAPSPVYEQLSLFSSPSRASALPEVSRALTGLRR